MNYDHGHRYIIEKGGVPYDERGYLRSNTTQLLGEEPKTSHKWTDLRNCTQFYTRNAANEAASRSHLDGMKVIIKVHAFDEYCETYDNKEWLWQIMGSV